MKTRHIHALIAVGAVGGVLGFHHWLSHSALLADYVRDKRNKVPDNRRDQSSIMGNLTKELSRPDMTWKVFCKGMKFLQFTRFEICLKCYKRDGSHSVHTLPVDLYESKDDAE